MKIIEEFGLKFGICRYLNEYRVGWLLFWVKRPFETVFQSISGRLPEREKEKRKDRREG